MKVESIYEINGSYTTVTTFCIRVQRVFRIKVVRSEILLCPQICPGYARVPSKTFCEISCIPAIRRRLCLSRGDCLLS
jgi:hypothetical protein